MQHRGLTLACAWLAAANARAPLLATGPLLPLIIPDLGMSFTIGGLLTGLPLVLMGAGGLPGGYLVDRVGARRVMIWTLSGIAFGGLIRGLAPDGAWLLAGTFVLGLSIGLLQPALPRVARDTLPRRTNLASAIYFNGLVVGGAAGVALTPWLVSLAGPFGWRGVLVGWCAFGAVGVLGWLAIGGRPRAAESHRSTSDAQHASSSRASDATLGPRANVAGEILDALRLPGMAALTVAMGVQSSIYYTFSSWLPSFLIARGWSLTSASLPVAMLPLTSVVAGLTAPPIEARIGRRATIGASGTVVVLGLVLFLLRPDETVWVVAITAGAGTTWAFSVCMAAPAALSPPHKVGITAGVLLAVGYAEAAIGPFALGTLRDAFGSWEAGWLLALGMAVVLVGTAAGIPGRSRPPPAGVAQAAGAASSPSSE